MNFNFDLYFLCDSRQNYIFGAYLIEYFWTVTVIIYSFSSVVSVSLVAVLNSFSLLAMTCLSAREKVQHSEYQRIYKTILQVAVFKSLAMVFCAIMILIGVWELYYLGGAKILYANALIEIIFIVLACKIISQTDEIITISEQAFEIDTRFEIVDQP